MTDSSADDTSVDIPGCSFEFRLDQERAVVLVSGEVDLATAPRLGECMEILLDQGVVRIDIDLRDVSFFDSQGVALLANTYRRLSALDGQLRVLQPQALVRRVLTISGLDKYLTIVPSGSQRLRARP